MTDITKGWDEKDVADQSGKVVLITGSNTGLGFENARALAAKGAKVILACRSDAKAAYAIAKIKSHNPSANVEYLSLDLASLKSVAAAAKQFKARHQRLDILINNAGIMMLPYSLTEDGFESQLGINHLGHFALTGHLLELLLKTPKSRVVSVSSMAHRGGKIHFNDLQLEKSYGKIKAYRQSKIANLYFAYELQRKLEDAGADCISLVAHPGGSATELGPKAVENLNLKPLTALVKRFAPLGGQSARMGALPQLFAATDPSAKGGEYYGPRFFEMIGHPKQVQSIGITHDRDIADRFWTISAGLTGVIYNFDTSAESASA